ncbi:MAG: hypothetical protein AAF690_28275 [Acidobacteriota bacterium]
MTRLLPAALAALTLGTASAFGDWLWAAYLTDGALVPAIVHGVAIFALLSTVLSVEADRGRSLARHLLALPALGLLLAALFYPLASVVGYLLALLLSWLGMWLGLALVGDWAPRRRTGTALLRGLAAGVASGLSFWTISGIWTAAGPAPDTFGASQHLVRALQWSWAFFPGFLALFWRRFGNPSIETSQETSRNSEETL